MHSFHAPLPVPIVWSSTLFKCGYGESGLLDSSNVNEVESCAYCGVCQHTMHQFMYK